MRFKYNIKKLNKDSELFGATKRENSRKKNWT